MVRTQFTPQGNDDIGITETAGFGILGFGASAGVDSYLQISNANHLQDLSHWFWNVSESISPDGLWILDGDTWMPRPFRWGKGTEIPKVLDKRPSKLHRVEYVKEYLKDPFYNTPLLAIGFGWIAVGMAKKFRIMIFDDVAKVLVVSQRLIWQFLNMNGITSGLPLLSLITKRNDVLYIKIEYLNRDARSLIGNQLRPNIEIGKAAQSYLVTVRLPGRSGRRFQIAGFRFGRDRNGF